MDQRTSQTNQTVAISVYGIVQGIGFRPFVAKLSDQYHLQGEVANVGGYVTIVVSGKAAQILQFIDALEAQKPPQSAIVHMEVKALDWQVFEHFEILDSEECQGDLVMLPVDLPVCETCLEEMQTQKDRRHEHPLISCMACGPRYSMIKAIPYDRVNTTMAEFHMCDECGKEYHSRVDRRYYAQTVSCNECGPYLVYHGEGRNRLKRESALDAAINDLNTGGIVAIKGIGGYHLACSPFKRETVVHLRDMKGREGKPFAVMFRDILELRCYCEVSEAEEVLLRSTARPIVLLKRKKSAISDEVYGFSREIGAFLPYTPVQHLILEKTGPLVMTSANHSGMPIIHEVEELGIFLERGLCGILDHQREIWARLDDSVARVVGRHTQIIRRSKGYVPIPLYLEETMPPLLGMGGQLKASFCLGKGHFAYPSEYFGDLEDEATASWYSQRLPQLETLLQIQPSVVICDSHPGYVTTALAQQMPRQLIQVQHHHAHIGSVMAEYQLEEVIGVAFDGTGYGLDGTIWGGEFLVCRGGEFERRGHLKTVPLIGGDESMKDASKTACCYLTACGCERLSQDSRKETIGKAIKAKINIFESSSIGRLFDALSSILGICHYNSFEGECAMRLEEQAVQAVALGKVGIPLFFEIVDQDGCWVMDYRRLLQQVLEWVAKGENVGELALSIHLAIVEALVDVVKYIGEATGISKVALSGGVFQNQLLLTNSLWRLEKEGFETYINEKVPPNDGGIALGQVYIGSHLLREVK